MQAVGVRGCEGREVRGRKRAGGGMVAGATAAEGHFRLWRVGGSWFVEGERWGWRG